MGVQMSRVCDIIILNMFGTEQLCRVYKVGCGWAFLWNVTSGGAWSWGVCTKRCVERFGFWRGRGGEKSDKLGRADVCRWVGEWDWGWWRKRRWEAG